MRHLNASTRRSKTARDFSWDGTENMETFLIPALVEWKEKRAAKALAGQDPNEPANEEEGDDDVEEGNDNGSVSDGDGSRQNDRDELVEGESRGLTADKKVDGGV